MEQQPNINNEEEVADSMPDDDAMNPNWSDWRDKEHNK